MSRLLLITLFGIFQFSDQVDFDSQQAIGLDNEMVAAGWLSLFDGQSLFGWRVESHTSWDVTDGTIHAKNGDVGLLRTAVQFDDFLMRLEFKSDSMTNSGVFIRTSPSPEDPVSDCYEINIAPVENPFPTGSIVKLKKASPVKQVQGWNTMTIKALGPRIDVWINEIQTVEFSDDETFLQKGYIGLQHNSGPIQFRNIVILPLRMEPIFSGDNLAGWNDEKKLASRLETNCEKELRLVGGLGQIETRRTFGDFVFSAHIKTNVVGSNSGVFFRCIPGELMNGYESQIQNELVNADRREPKDAGSGGIFRRQNARLVNANDGRWFAKSIIANGATVCVWINGYQVVDWTDKRKPHSNPRKGLRLKAGTIILQGHDESTDVSFKKICARELLPRRRR